MFRAQGRQHVFGEGTFLRQLFLKPSSDKHDVRLKSESPPTLRLLFTKFDPLTSILKTSNGCSRWSFLATLPGFENYRGTATGYLEHLGLDSG